jgi:glyoxylase-like metal-dependent hydrolase (beta-lactamase superfamily II)
VTEFVIRGDEKGNPAREQAVVFALRPAAAARDEWDVSVQRQVIVSGMAGGPNPRERGLSVGKDLIQREVVGPWAVFFTHLHAPQVEAFRGFQGDAVCFVGNAERPSGSLRFLCTDPLAFAAGVKEFSFEKAQDMPPLGPCIDVLGDGSLWAISTPGYTLGSVSYLLMDVDGPILVTGLLTRAIPDRQRGFDGGRHRELGCFSLQRLRDFLDLYPTVRLAPGIEHSVGSRPAPGIGHERAAAEAADEDEAAGGLFE